MTTNSAGLVQSSCTSTRVHSDRLANDEAILSEFSDCLAGVGRGDFGGFVWIEPDLALSTVQNIRREALLRAEVDPTSRFQSVSAVNDFNMV